MSIPMNQLVGVYMCMWLWLCACFSNAPELPEPTGVLESNLTNHVTVLASDEFLGRGTFESGLDKAAEYITAEFQRYGLQTVDGSDSFIVPYNLYQYTWEKNSSLTIAKGEETLKISNAQWRPFKHENKFNPNHSVNLDDAPLIFAGYGIDAPEHEWNDYADLDVT